MAEHFSAGLLPQFVDHLTCITTCFDKSQATDFLLSLTIELRPTHTRCKQNSEVNHDSGKHQKDQPDNLLQTDQSSHSDQEPEP